MANREACEVYIDQEIDTGLKQGKTPYSIGKELSKWIVKLFEVKIDTNTIIRRAERKREKDLTTNVVKQSNNAVKPASYKPDPNSVTHPPTDRGGKREGAGRPALKPATTKRDDEFFAEFAYPVEMISNGTFTIEEIHTRLLVSSQTKINYFKKTFELLKAVNAKGVDI